MPTARRWRCCRARPRPRSRCSRPPPPTASPAWPRLAADPLFAPLAGDAAAGGAPRRGPAAGAGPGQGRPGAGRCRQHRLEPRDRAAGAALRLPGQDRRPGAAAEARAAPPRTSWPSSGAAAAPPATTAISTTTATAATRGSIPRRIRSSAFVTYAEAARAAELDYGLNEQLALRPPDLRQLLDRDHRRRALAQPAALRDDPGRRHRAAPALAERRGEPALRLSGAQGLRPEERRPLPGQHPLHPGLARLLGLGQAVPRGHGADPRRLPPRHQGAAGRRGPDGADRADGLPPLAAERALARGLLQRRRAPGGLRGLRDQPRPHGQPRQLDQARRHPAAGRASG